LTLFPDPSCRNTVILKVDIFGDGTLKPLLRLFAAQGRFRSPEISPSRRFIQSQNAKILPWSWTCCLSNVKASVGSPPPGRSSRTRLSGPHLAFFGDNNLTGSPALLFDVDSREWPETDQVDCNIELSSNDGRCRIRLIDCEDGHMRKSRVHPQGPDQNQLPSFWPGYRQLPTLSPQISKQSSRTRCP
jgi:hypothetical protein